MKKALTRIGVAAALLLCSNSLLQAQMPAASANPISPSLLKIFGSQTNFSASTELKVTGGADPVEGSSKIAMLDGKVRLEVDMAKMKSKTLPPEMLMRIKEMGFDKNIVIVRPDKSVTYTLYPGLNSYIEMPMKESEKQAMAKEPKITSTTLGKETVDEHPCIKNKMVITDENDKPREVIVWNATDMKNFPIQMEMKEQEATITTKFKDIKFARPDSKLFDPPTGYKKYDSMQQLQQAVMQKMMGVER